MLTKLATVDQLPPGALIEVEHNGVPYALCNVGGHIRALWGECPHQGGPIGQGALEGPMVTCPWHCWQFDSLSGLCLFGADVAIPTYAVMVEGNDVMVELPGPESEVPPAESSGV